MLAHDTPALQIVQRVRDEAHRFAITHHRSRRDKAMTASVLDDLPGIGPARKRALLAPLRLARRGAEASRDDLEAVPGLPAKVGRQIFITSAATASRTSSQRCPSRGVQCN